MMTSCWTFVRATSGTRRRAVAPLLQADDADRLDTSELTIDQAVAEAVRLVERQLADA